MNRPKSRHSLKVVTSIFNDAFVHFFVDSDSITQVASTDYIAWGAGPEANPRFVHVELCQTKNDGSQDAANQFHQAYNRYVWLLGDLLFQRKLGVSDATLWSHYRVSHELGGSDHEDPIAYLAEWNKTWDNVKNDVLYVYNVLSNPPVDIRKLKLKEIANEIDFMLTLVPASDGNAEWALNWGAQVYDIMHDQKLVKDI